MESGVFMRRKRLAGVPHLLGEFMSCRSAASGDLTTLGPVVELPVSLRARFRPTRVPWPRAVGVLLRSLPHVPDPC